MFLRPCRTSFSFELILQSCPSWGQLLKRSKGFGGRTIVCQNKSCLSDQDLFLSFPFRSSSVPYWHRPNTVWLECMPAELKNMSFFPCFRAYTNVVWCSFLFGHRYWDCISHFLFFPPVFKCVRDSAVWDPSVPLYMDIGSFINSEKVHGVSFASTYAAL